jgi:hypothetical protein
MNTRGKLTDVIIEENKFGLTVWADPGAENKIREIDGVHYVSSDNSCKYIVFLDARYDKEYVKNEIYFTLTSNAIFKRVMANLKG